MKKYFSIATDTLLIICILYLIVPETITSKLFPEIKILVPYHLNPFNFWHKINSNMLVLKPFA